VKKAFGVLTILGLAFIVGLWLAAFFANDAQAKPNMCVLTIEPFYICEPHPSCHNPGEEKCIMCHGWDLYGEPCLCVRMGCMIPPQ
jgi:hypothetical protein